MSGLRARGGFEVDMEWGGGGLRVARVRSLLGNPCTVGYGERSVTFDTEAGAEYVLDEQLEVQ